jgi:nickel/cobalt transporter (NicO) family protein
MLSTLIQTISRRMRGVGVGVMWDVRAVRAVRDGRDGESERRTPGMLVALILALSCAAMAPAAHATDVFGVPDDASPQQATPSHALPLPDGIRHVIAEGLVLQGEMNDALQSRVADLQNLGSPSVHASAGAAPRRGWLTLLELVGLCIGYGVLHALAPGHGKFVVASQFATRRARRTEVMSLSLRIALGQSLTAIVLVGAVVLFARAAAGGATNGAMTGAGPLELISNIALIAVGLVAAFRIMTGRDCCAPDTPLKLATTPRNDDTSDESSGNTYLGSALSPMGSLRGSLRGTSKGGSATGGDKLTKARPRFVATAASTATAGGMATRATSNIPYRGVRGLGLATSLRPCAGALFVLLVASTAHVFWAGALAALSIGLGVAATIGLIGLGVASTTAFMLTRPRLKRLFERTQRGLALSGALLIVLFGGLQIALLATGVTVLGPG